MPNELPLHLLREARALLGVVVLALVAEGPEDLIQEIVIVDLFYGG